MITIHVYLSLASTFFRSQTLSSSQRGRTRNLLVFIRYHQVATPSLAIIRLLAWGVVGLAAVRTRLRIPDWMDDFTLFHSVLRACPNSAKANNQVGQLWGNLATMPRP